MKNRDEEAIPCNLTFRRVHLEGKITDASYLRNRGGRFGSITFDRCSIGGKPARTAADLKLRIEGEVPTPVFR